MTRQRLDWGLSGVLSCVPCVNLAVRGLCASPQVKPPARPCQWENPGQTLHIDIRRPGRIDGVAAERREPGKSAADIPSGNVRMFLLTQIRKLFQINTYY